MKRIAALTLALYSALLCIAHDSGDKAKKFTVDAATGVKYRFVKQNKKGVKPKLDDYATVILIYKNDRDSLILDSRKGPNRRPDDSIGTVLIPLKKTFNGCLEQGITMMAVGDSAVFSVSTDSLFFKTFRMRTLPHFVRGGTFLTFYVKLVKFQTQEQLNQEQEQQRLKKQMEVEKRKAEEPQLIAKYLSDNKLNIQPTADSVYFLSRQPGSGKQIKEGDSVAVKYTGTLLDGRVFDATDMHGGQPLKFVYSKNMHLIQGWIYAFASMHEGDKVKILLPSKLAYGAQQANALILPYSTLIFDIEVVKVVEGNFFR